MSGPISRSKIAAERKPRPTNELRKRMQPEADDESPRIAPWHILVLAIVLGLVIVGGTVAAIVMRNHKPVRVPPPTPAAQEDPAVTPSVQPTPEIVVENKPASDPAPAKTAPPVVQTDEPKPKTGNAFSVAAARVGNRVGSKPKTATIVAETAETEKPKPVVKRRFSYTDAEELRRQLILAPEAKLHHIPADSRRLLASAPKTRIYTPDEMPDFAGLPMRMGIECQLGKESAENLQALSRKLRTFMANATERNRATAAVDPRGPSADTIRGMMGIIPDTGNSPLSTAAKLADLADHNNNEWLQPEAVPTLMQMLMAENKPLRLLLIELLSAIRGQAASTALAQRAVFDLSPEVREAAIQALNERPPSEYRDSLLSALRYPWAPAADHAAEALAALKDRDSIPQLVKLLDQPSPSQPFVSVGEKDYRVREIVQINHLGNCAMCHAQSVASTDPVRGQIPSPSQPLPPPVQYYDNGNGIFVRADVTYLRQDFSAPQPVSSPGPWPSSQRFDYLVRTRSLTANEITALKFGQSLSAQNLRDLAAKDAPRYEQREAVLFALRELTGIDLGSSTSKWQQYAIDEGLVKR